MKLKHYYNMYTNKLSGSREELSEIAYNMIINKLIKLSGVDMPERVTELPPMTSIEELSFLLGGEFNSLILSLYALNLEKGDYFKYYLLDKLTNGRYIDALLTCIYKSAEKGQLFLSYFDESNFYENKTTPTIMMEYLANNQNEILSPSIIYYNPFNGEMEIEDFLSMVVADQMYLLNPDMNSKYLLEKIMNGVTCIPFSQNKYINLIGYPQNEYNKTISTNYVPGIGKFSRQLYGKLIINVENKTEGVFVGNRQTSNITQLTDNLHYYS